MTLKPINDSKQFCLGEFKPYLIDDKDTKNSPFLIAKKGHEFLFRQSKNIFNKKEQVGLWKAFGYYLIVYSNLALQILPKTN